MDVKGYFAAGGWDDAISLKQRIGGNVVVIVDIMEYNGKKEVDTMKLPIDRKERIVLGGV